MFYLFDRETGKRESLRTFEPSEAGRLARARNDSHENPGFNLRLARMYLAAADPQAASRTWRAALETLIGTKEGPTRERWLVAMKQAALRLLLDRRLLETRADHLLSVLKQGTVATNVFLRRLHNFALDMGWLAAPLLLKRQWPRIRFRPKRAITVEEHQRIINAERNPELNAFYRLCWHLGGAQSDLASLKAEDFDRKSGTLSLCRRKTGTPVILQLSQDVVELLAKLPATGLLFPRLHAMHEKHRAKLFHRRCRLLGIHGVSLHSYRYAWAERALACGYPERFAQAALGHNSKAVHRAYARKAIVRVPSLEAYERPPGTSNALAPPAAAVTAAESVQTLM